MNGRAGQVAAGFSRIDLASVDSTNAFALDKATLDVPDRCWVVADCQTGGRGRHGRIWQSPPGNLYATLLLIAPCPVRDAPRLGFVAGVAVADAVLACAPALETRLKWPNDLLARSGAGEWSKLTGILLEGRMLPDGRQAVAVGIGVNVRHAPRIEGRAVASLADFGSLADRDAVFAALSGAVGRWLAVFGGGDGFADIRAAWLERAFALGTPMTVMLPTGSCAGRFAGIDADGRLGLDTDAGMVHVDAGDVFLATEA